LLQEGENVGADQINSVFPITNRQRMANGIGDESLRLKPVTGTSMQLGDQERVAFLQVASQELGEQWVVAVPVLLIIQ
jgi:hypothetical protein